MMTGETYDSLLSGPGDERRNGADRRRGRERRGSGWRQPPTAEPRPYGFRSFTDRRSDQDRRTAWRDPFAARGDQRHDWNGDGPVIELSAEEIAVLFDRDGA